MAGVGSIIAPGANLGLMYAERLLKDVTPAMFGRLARPGGVVLQSNHPAFVFGHLCLYPSRVMQNLELPPGVTAFPANYESLFKNGAECQDDPDGKIFPAMNELTALYFDAYRAAIAAVESADDEMFHAPNPAEGRLRDLFPTVGAAVNFYLTGHVQVHFGQISAWRRAMGLPPA